MSCRVHTDVQEEKAVRTDKAGAEAAGGAERKQGAGGAYDDEEVIREYIKNQENDDRRQDELFD